MPTPLNIAIAQLNLLVGDIEGNAAQVIKAANDARTRLGADVIVFPELTLTGYPPEDLLLRPGLYARVEQAMADIARQVQGIDVVLGFPHSSAEGEHYNAAALLRAGECVAIYHKQILPNYGVFDEKRHFQAGTTPCIIDIKGVPVAISICEDIWFLPPLQQAAQAGARLMLNLNASPFHINKSRERTDVVRSHVLKTGVPVVYANLVGGQDELVFDGASFVMDASGEVTQHFPAFKAGVYLARFTIEDQAVVPVPQQDVQLMTEEESVYHALVLGVRDYVQKNSFPGVILGLSGGIDSALTLAIAVDAIGAENVEAVMMPSRYTSQLSLDDARTEARTLGVEYHEFSIEAIFEAALQTLQNEFAGTAPDVTEENIQARARCMLLMAVSNKKNKMVLTTGNKSEMAVGYATLYGDMAGGFNALKDVPKTLVYKLALYRNRLSPVIPDSVIQRPPSAELKPDQKDADSLPDYAVLDAILEHYVEQDKSADDIVALGYEAAIVAKVIRMVDQNEYKRRQAAPGVRITRRAFGRDRRYPITSGFNKH